jgi:signal transduction histidine kinase
MFKSWMGNLNNLHPASAPQGLYRRVNIARVVLPPLIVLVVLFYELVFVELGKGVFRLWAHVAFYGIVGPLVTFYTITWILEGVKLRRAAELELLQLYSDLKEANKRLDTVGQLIRSLAEASDLEEVLDTAIAGIAKATQAHSGLITLPGGIERAVDMAGEVTSKLEEWPDLFPATPLERFEEGLHRISLPLNWSGQRVGFLHLRYIEEPSGELRSLLESLSSEVGTALEAAERRSRDLVTLYQVDQSIRAERNMDRLLERILGQMAQRSGAEARAVYLVDEDGVLRLTWAQDFAQQIHHGGSVSNFAKQVALERKALRTSGGSDGIAQDGTAENLTSKDLTSKDLTSKDLTSKDLTSSDVTATDGIFAGAVSRIGLPMLSENKLEGVIVLGYLANAHFDQARLPLLALMANQTSLAVRNARAYLYSEELAIGDERNRIAREIHDGVAQNLAFTALKLDLVERLIPKDPAKAILEVQFSKQNLREQIKEVRRSIFALRPIDLERFGLLETVRQYVQDFGEQNNIRSHLELVGEIRLTPSDEAIIFRVLQESLNNVAKHAKASNVWVRLALKPSASEVLLHVTDDGQGFDPSALTGRVSTAGGMGLHQMRERLEARGGRYLLSSAPGSGSQIQASLPTG